MDWGSELPAALGTRVTRARRTPSYVGSPLETDWLHFAIQYRKAPLLYAVLAAANMLSAQFCILQLTWCLRNVINMLDAKCVNNILLV